MLAKRQLNRKQDSVISTKTINFTRLHQNATRGNNHEMTISYMMLWCLQDERSMITINCTFVEVQ